ncbi:hypothetical protein [Sphingomonas oryzagri]|uniref:Uncharacterized protein n=1 Tax=Sphingomonas oryzagri TaxID=3042314 RepID=A0ABT6N419_9SPHN|nr:hypothetical protein [Sphingomonas oryzagri]MDH7639982.1 hypothetical protein [Sphingomonas oryzagri]
MTKMLDRAAAADIHHHVPAVSSDRDDPMLPDETGDERVGVTRRGLVRLAMVAAEVGARFQREGVAHDPMAWMLSPRAVFDGETAIDACIDLAPAMRAIMLHGLGLGLDATPEEIDDLMADDEGGEEDGDDVGIGAIDPPSAHVIPLNAGSPRLWTALLVDESDDGIVHAFEAMVAPGPEVARERIRQRHGARIAHGAEIREGFDATQPLAEALVAPAVQDILAMVAVDPASPLAQGLEVTVSQRFCE